jgi:hypothetical protein
VRAALLVAGVWAFSAATLAPMWLGWTRCPSVTLFHAPCPGCGMTRALVALAHGEVGESLSMHALAVPTALVQIVLALATVAVALRHGSPFVIWSLRWGKGLLGVAALIAFADLALWIARSAGAFGGPVPV